ncbi:MAG: hypothetical protein EXQ67_03250 [Thermoleophilia bacterium]|nr:hypothetical protein [Thermoleophilia bacterium]
MVLGDGDAVPRRPVGTVREADIDETGVAGLVLDREAVSECQRLRGFSDPELQLGGIDTDGQFDARADACCAGDNLVEGDFIVYRYATEGVTPEGFSAGDLDAVFRPKKKRL